MNDPKFQRRWAVTMMRTSTMTVALLLALTALIDLTR